MLSLSENQLNLDVDENFKGVEKITGRLNFDYILVLLEMVLLLGVCLYIEKQLSYWTNKGLYQHEDILLSVIYNYAMRKKTFGSIIGELYNLAKSNNEKHIGSYFCLTPFYVPVDLTIIKNIMVKDFNHFTDRGMVYNPGDILSKSLFNMEGEEWKDLRQKLTPIFEISKMKIMFRTIEKNIPTLRNMIKSSMLVLKSIEIRFVLLKFTTNIIGSCGFGIPVENDIKFIPDNKFQIFSMDILTSSLWNFLSTTIVHPRNVNNLSYMFNSDLVNYFEDVVKYKISTRKGTKLNSKDFIQLMLKLKNTSIAYSHLDEEQKQLLTDDEIFGQCFEFSFSGMDKSSTTVIFALFEMTQNENIQNKLRKNINEVLQKYNRKVTYDALMEMDYLDKVINETLRKYPPLTTVQRVCTETYNIPGSNITIEKGTRVQIPIWAIHKDPEYYPDPETFDPERFSEENIKKRPDFTFFPFGEGPRKCLGIPYAMLQTKYILMSLIQEFKFTIDETKYKHPLKFELDPRTLKLSFKHDFWCNVG